MSDQEQLPLGEREVLRRESARWWINLAREALGCPPYTSRDPCPTCQITSAVLIRSGNQNVVRCACCGRALYNAPKTETGERQRSVLTVREAIKPSQQARIFNRDHGRCVLCGRDDAPLTVGHLLSIADGLALGATERELDSDANLAAMCEACNLGLGSTSVLPATYARIIFHLIRAANQSARTPEAASSETNTAAVPANNLG